MPYVYVFSVGEALRSGVGPDAHFTPFRAIAYALIGLAEFGVFAPVYLLRLYRNYRRQRDGRVEESGKASPTAPDSMPGTPDGAGRG